MVRYLLPYRNTVVRKQVKGRHRTSREGGWSLTPTPGYSEVEMLHNSDHLGIRLVSGLGFSLNSFGSCLIPFPFKSAMQKRHI